VGRRYLYNGNFIEAGPGLGEGRYFTRWQSDSGGWHRVCSVALPVRDTQEAAQADLDAWAKRKGLEKR